MSDNNCSTSTSTVTMIATDSTGNNIQHNSNNLENNRTKVIRPQSDDQINMNGIKTITNEEKQRKLRAEIRSFVETIFQDSQSISLTEKAKFGKLVRHPEARLWFARFVDEYRVNSKLVSELTFYSLAQYFSIVLFECLADEDFQPAKIIMNMMFTYYYYVTNSTKPSGQSVQSVSQEGDSPSRQQIYLYQFLKDQQIFKSIRFWTSAFYESVISERNNHQVFKTEPFQMETEGSDLKQDSTLNSAYKKVSQDKRNEELNCSRNITFGLLGSFIHNMMLLGLSQSFCQEFLDKHSTIAGLDKEQCDALYDNLMAMFISMSDEGKQNLKAAHEPRPLFRKPLSFSVKNLPLQYKSKFK